jgi:WD40 repeat protein/ABC-type branched-subunit amino acid transport system substrate-binding protein
MSDSPYPGLRPFRRDESDIFFGRDELSIQLLERLYRTHFLAVVGQSGCGKSSLVHAGLLADLEKGWLRNAGIRWRIAEFRPGNCPFTRLTETLLTDEVLKAEYTAHFIDNTDASSLLAAHLRRGPLSLHEILRDSPLPPQTNLLIVVDQFEELFRYRQPDTIDELAAFVWLLLESSKHPLVYVVITIRSDFMSDCASYSDLPEAINEGVFLVPYLRREQLQQAIEGPAKVYDGQVEAQLINQLLNGMKSDPKQLPVLQHALMRMWKLAQADNPQQPLLTFQHYEKIGQLAGALSSHADEAYAELTTLISPAQPQQVAEILFRRLCERDPARRDTRSPVNLSEVTELAGLSSWEDMVPVLDIFRRTGRHFLTPGPEVKLNPETVIDIGHESLIEHWQNLNKWVGDEAKSADTYRRLEDSACRWEAGKAELLSGVELETTSKWFKEENPTAIWAKRYGEHFELAKHFLEESEAAWQKEEERKEAERQKEKAERQWKLRVAIGVIIGLLIVTGIVTLLAIRANVESKHAISEKQKAKVAQNEAVVAKKQAEEAEKQAIKARKKREVDLFESHLTHATLLTRYGDYAGAKDTLEKTRALDSTVEADRHHARNLLAWFNKFMGASPKQTYQDAGAPLFAVALSSDGNYLVTVGENGTTVLFDTQDSRLLRRLEGHDTEKSVRTVVFHPQDQWFASAGEDGKIIFWSLSKIKDAPDPDKVKLEDIILNSKELPKIISEEKEKDVDITALAVSPDGKYLASGGTDENVTLWDVENIKEIRKLYTFTGHTNLISDLAFSPNRELLASASHDKTVRLWQIQTRQELHTLKWHTDEVEKVAFSPDGQWLASSSNQIIRLWKINSDEAKVLLGHDNTVFDIDFTADGQYLVSASDDLTLRLWDTQYGVTMRVLQGHTAGVNNIAVSQGDIFSASDDRTVRRWDMSLPQQQAVDLPAEPASVAIAPDGSSIAVGFSNGALRLYSLSLQSKSDLLWEQLTAHNDEVKRLAFSSDSTLLASASFDQTVKIWQIKAGRLQQTLKGHTGEISAVAFSPDNHTIATASYDGQIGLFTVGTEQKRFSKAHEEEEINAVSFNKDGTQLLSTSDYRVRLWKFSSDTLKLTLSEEYPKTKNILMWSALSPDEKQIVSVGRDQIVHIYSTKSKDKRYDLIGHESTIYRAIYSLDGKQVATISADASLRLWDLHDQGSELFTLHLPAKSGGIQWDFDFRCTLKANCWIAVPLEHNKLMLYELGDSYKKKKEEEEPKVRPEVNNEQFIPLTMYRKGPYAAGGGAILDGNIDYMKMLNERDDGINGIKLSWGKECETYYDVEQALKCYEQLKHQGVTGAAMFNFQSTNATYAVLERARNDEIPILSIGLGRSDSIDGSVFDYVFPLLTTYWNQNTAKIKFIGEKEGGLEQLKGKTIADVYHHSKYGTETIQVLEKQAEKYGFIVKYFPITPPGHEQRSTWDQIERLKPDWIILRGWGEMNPVALREAKRIGFPTDHIIGVWWSGSEEDVKPAGDAAKGFITTNFHAAGDDFKVIQDIKKYVKDNQLVKEKDHPSIYYKRGIVFGILSTEAIRTAQEKYGHQPLSGKEVRWGLEHLNITEEQLKKLGAEGFFSPIKTSCANHEGGGKVIFQQWDGKKWVIISDWIEPDYDITRPLVKESAEKYAEEKGITPRDCSQEE